MRKLKRLLALTLALLSIAALAAGCAGTETPPTSDPTPTEKEDETTKEPETTDGNSGDTDDNTAAGDDDKYGGTMTFCHYQDVQQPNFIITSDMPGGFMRGFVFEKLFAHDENANLVPRLATGYKMSDDGLTYTVTLRDGVTWHDGEPYTADDVVFYWEYYTSLLGIDNYATASNVDFYTVEKVDDLTVNFILDAPRSTFPWSNLGYHSLPKHIWEDVEPNQWSSISDPAYFVGIGPFKFVERKAGESITLARYDEYWDGKPYLDSIVYRIVADTDAANLAFESGQVDFYISTFPVMEQLEGDSGFDFLVYPSGNMRLMLMNHEDPRMTLPVRQALSYLMNRERIIIANQSKSDVMKTAFTSADTFYNPSAADATAFEYNPEKAIQILEDDGWVLNADGIREKDGMVLDFEWISFLQDNPYGVVIIDDCKQAGINLTLNALDVALYVERLNVNDFEIATGGMTMGPTPAGYKSIYAEGRNTSYVNDEIAELFAKAFAASSDAEAQGYYDDIQRIITEDRGLIWLFESTRIWGVTNGLNLDECGINGLYQGWINIGKAYFEK